MTNETLIKVTPELLALDLDPHNKCGCYIHEAIMCSKDPEFASKDAEVDYKTIKVGDRSYLCSPVITVWQQQFIEDGFTNEDAEPIEIIFDNDTWLAYTKKDLENENFIEYLKRYKETIKFIRVGNKWVVKKRPIFTEKENEENTQEESE